VTPGDFFDTQPFSGVTDGNDGVKAFVGMQLFENTFLQSLVLYLGKSSVGHDIGCSRYR
jgi:hypothetical protein